MTKTNTDRRMLTRAGTAGMLILGALLMGCDKDSQQHNDKALAGQVSKPAPTEEKPDRDWSQPYQIMPIGDALIKIPRGYLSRRDYGDGNSKGLNEHMKLETTIVLTPEGKPKFLTRDEARKISEDRKGQARYVYPFDAFGGMIIDVNKGDYDFKKGSFASDERSVMDRAFSPSKVQDFSPPMDLIELGLKAYRRVHDVKENGKVVRSIVTMVTYFPLDTNFKMPNGSPFYLRCDPVPIDPKEAAYCDAGFVPRDRIAVRYTFPPQHLRHWKEIHQFVLNTLQFTN